MRVLDHLALLLVSITVGIIRRLPPGPALFVARRIIGLILFVMPRLKGVGRRNLELVFPEKSQEEREAILKRSFSLLAKNLVDYAKLPDLTRERAGQLIDYSRGKEICERLRAQNPGRGVILATLHYGSFELIIQLQALHVRPAWILARGFGLERLDEWWFSRRELFGCTVFRRKGAFPEIVRRLQSGEDVAILFDQNVKRNHAVFADFLGISAATTKTLALAAIRTGAPVAIGVMHENADGTFTLFCDEIPTAPKPDEDGDALVLRITESLNAAASRYIRAHPENWFWIHRRFKTRPPEEREDLYGAAPEIPAEA